MIPGAPQLFPAIGPKVETAGIEPAQCSRQGWVPKGEAGPCAFCGKIFVAKRKPRKCCSQSCGAQFARLHRSYTRRPLEERFWQNVTPGRPDECWEWNGYGDQRGYGRLSSPEHPTLKAHRLSWQIHRGAIPDGLHVLHHCDNPPCVNPAHLYLGTHADNMDDIARRRRSGAMKFSDEKVRELRVAVCGGMSIMAAARTFGISESQAHNLVKGYQRRYAGGPMQIKAALRDEDGSAQEIRAFVERIDENVAITLPDGKRVRLPHNELSIAGGAQVGADAPAHLETTTPEELPDGGG